MSDARRMIFTKLRLLACLSLACLASNVDADCSRVKGNFMLYTVWSTYLPKPIKRLMEVSLTFDSPAGKQECKFAEEFGSGDYMQKWTGDSDDYRCIVHADTVQNQIMVRYDGLVFTSAFTPEEVNEPNAGSPLSFQKYLYNDIDLSRGC